MLVEVERGADGRLWVQGALWRVVRGVEGAGDEDQRGVGWLRRVSAG